MTLQININDKLLKSEEQRNMKSNTYPIVCVGSSRTLLLFCTTSLPYDSDVIPVFLDFRNVSAPLHHM